MGRSSNACFKIIACGSDSAEDEIERTESKGSTDKRGWSFRKRSARHRVLSNIVSSELPPTANKDSPEAPTADFHAQCNPAIPGKDVMPKWKDEVFPSGETESKASTDLLPLEKPDSIENSVDVYSSLPESAVILIQAAIRGYLARRSLYKLKHVVKLQAAFRGHLVRRHAVGTLRCVQAIVKMQVLVRARRARQSIEGKPLEKKNSGLEANNSYYSTKKLLANGFARQLLETRPKTKPIHIQCDSSKHNSAWQWLERWMAVSSEDISQSTKNPLEENGSVQGKIADPVVSELIHEVVLESSDLKSSDNETKKSVSNAEELKADNADDVNFHPHETMVLSSFKTSVEEDSEDPGQECFTLVSGQDDPPKSDTILNETPETFSNQSNTSTLFSLPSIPDKPEVDMERLKPVDREKSEQTAKRTASEQLGTEGKKFMFGPRKAINPAFAAVQSKFEELSSNATSARSIGSYRDTGVESHMDSPQSHSDSVTSTARPKEFAFKEDSTLSDTGVDAAGSECGTELSITSTLDSPDRSEMESGALAPETLVADALSSRQGSVSEKLDLMNVKTDAEKSSAVSETYLLSIQGKAGEVNGGSTDSFAAMDELPEEQQSLKPTTSDLHMQLEGVGDKAGNKSSPEGSPRSHITVPDSQQGTPSSQISVNAKRNKSDGGKARRKSHLVGIRSPSTINHDSGGRSSTEHIQKDPKPGKRRNSFDHESRTSSSTNSLPNYMQATESARAKIHSHTSPKSSPDVTEKDVYVKKRHSLPATNGKQESPRMQRSMSQAQPTTKPTERKWQR